MGFELFYAPRLLSCRQWALLIIGVAVAVATVVFGLMSVADYEATLTNSLLNGRPHVRLYCPEQPESDLETLSRKIGQLPNVRSSIVGYRVAGPFRFTVLDRGTKDVIYSESIQAEIVGYSFRSDIALPIDIKRVYSKQCRNRGDMDPLAIMQDYSTKNRVLVDEELVRQLFRMPLPSGESFEVMLRAANSEPVSQSLTTAGSYMPPVIGISEATDHSIYARKEEIQPIDSTGSRLANCLDLKLVEPNSADIVVRQLRPLLSSAMKAETWMERDNDKLAFLRTIRSATFIATSLLLGLAGFGVYFIVSMVVEDKYRQIATLRALGASNASVRRVFYCCGFIIATAGVCSGLPAGWSAAYLFHAKQRLLMQNFFNTVDGTLPAPVIALAFTCLMAYLFCFIGFWVPSQRAFRVEPASLMRAE